MERTCTTISYISQGSATWYYRTASSIVWSRTGGPNFIRLGGTGQGVGNHIIIVGRRGIWRIRKSLITFVSPHSGTIINTHAMPSVEREIENGQHEREE